jgi:acetolactate synthase-1/2/3 large subunit
MTTALTMTLSRYISSRLADLGTTFAFGVPGAFVMPVWQELNGTPQIILSRHETGGAYMADGYSRVTGKIGVLVATVGPGIANCLPGVTAAYRDSTPMLVVTGQNPVSSFGRGAFLESFALDRSPSPVDVFKPITKASFEIVSIEQAKFFVDTALRLATSGRPGPVHLSIPIDLQQQEIPGIGSRLPLRSSRNPQPETLLGTAVEAAAQALGTARRPLILAGWGAWQSGAAELVNELAGMIDAPVLTTTKGLVVGDAVQQHLLGHVGPGQRGDIASFLKEYDCDALLVAGASLSAYYCGPLQPALQSATLIRIDVDADQLYRRFEPDVAVLGDVGAALTGVLARLRAEPAPPRESPQEQLTAWHRTAADALQRQGIEHGDSVSMAGFVGRLRALLPEDSLIIPDAGNHWLDVLALTHQPPSGLRVLANCGLGSMGWAIGAAVGAAFADVGRKVVCVTGDGSMLMHGTELSVAAEHGRDLSVIVFNNRAHGRVRLGQKLDFGAEQMGTDIEEVDFTAWAAAMGITSGRVSTVGDVEAVAAPLLRRRGTVLIEVMCSPDEMPACLRNWIDAE